MESVIRFFLIWMQSSVLYCKKAYNYLNIKENFFGYLFSDSFNGWSEILADGICNHVLVIITVKMCIFAIGM